MRAKAAAPAAAFVALAGGLAAGSYVLAREEAPEPAPPTTTTTSTTVPDAVVAAALAEALTDTLHVAIDDTGARCLGEALLVTVGRDRLEVLAGSADPLASLPDGDRAQLVRDVVTCVGPEAAAALLGTATTTTEPAAFPDAGQE
jgi:hypothetical protein